jgi:hypothetical protein
MAYGIRDTVAIENYNDHTTIKLKNSPRKPTTTQRYHAGRIVYTDQKFEMSARNCNSSINIFNPFQPREYATVWLPCLISRILYIKCLITISFSYAKYTAELSINFKLIDKVL